MVKNLVGKGVVISEPTSGCELIITKFVKVKGVTMDRDGNPAFIVDQIRVCNDSVTQQIEVTEDLVKFSLKGGIVKPPEEFDQIWNAIKSNLRTVRQILKSIEEGKE